MEPISAVAEPTAAFGESRGRIALISYGPSKTRSSSNDMTSEIRTMWSAIWSKKNLYHPLYWILGALYFSFTYAVWKYCRRRWMHSTAMIMLCTYLILCTDDVYKYLFVPEAAAKIFFSPPLGIFKIAFLFSSLDIEIKKKDARTQVAYVFCIWALPLVLILIFIILVTLFSVFKYITKRIRRNNEKEIEIPLEENKPAASIEEYFKVPRSIESLKKTENLDAQDLHPLERRPAERARGGRGVGRSSSRRTVTHSRRGRWSNRSVSRGASVGKRNQISNSQVEINQNLINNKETDSAEKIVAKAAIRRTKSRVGQERLVQDKLYQEEANQDKLYQNDADQDNFQIQDLSQHPSSFDKTI